MLKTTLLAFAVVMTSTIDATNLKIVDSDDLSIDWKDY